MKDLSLGFSLHPAQLDSGLICPSLKQTSVLQGGEGGCARAGWVVSRARGMGETAARGTKCRHENELLLLEGKLKVK